jgi:hypothetical protein
LKPIEYFKKIKIFADGKTLPEIKSGQAILLIQNGTVQVGKLNIGDSYDFNMEIEHPTNQLELKLIATELIENKKPDYLKSKYSIIIECPTEISELMVWD